MRTSTDEPERLESIDTVVERGGLPPKFGSQCHAGGAILACTCIVLFFAGVMESSPLISLASLFGIVLGLVLFIVGASIQNGGTVARTDSETHRLYGRHDKVLIVDGGSIRIIKRGSVFSTRREKTIPIRNIGSVEVAKPSGFTPGFIQFGIAGGAAHNSSFTLTGGAFGAAGDENSVLFDAVESYRAALKIKAFIETYRDKPAPVASSFSVADELLKLKSLMDAGVISPNEFQAQKRKLMEP